MGTCDAATRPHPTTDPLATAKQRRSASAAHARATRTRRASIGRRGRWGRHALSRATEAVAGVTRQSLTCAAILAGSVIAQLEGHHWAAVLTASSTLTLAALTLLLLTLKQRSCQVYQPIYGFDLATLCLRRTRHRRPAPQRSQWTNQPSPSTAGWTAAPLREH
jgi:hypothetical protein